MDSKFSSLIKPTLNTKFRVDFDWWKNQDQNWKVYLQSFLCEEHKKILANFSYEDQIDLVNPQTGEVTKEDALLYTLINHCARQPDFLSENTALVDSIFKIFLVNQNQPLTPIELSKIINRPADLILRTIGSGKVYRGIRPV